MKNRFWIVAALNVGGAVLAAGASAQMPPAAADGGQSEAELPDWAAGYDESVRRDLARVRDVTAPFRDIAEAQKVGYPTTMPQCLENQPHGGMGLHYGKQDLMDATLDVEQPEILVYAPTESGKPRLVGVEYIVPYSVWDRERKPPTIFGQDLRRADGLNLWYLHVWAWEPNEKGLFDDWNPAVKC